MRADLGWCAVFVLGAAGLLGCSGAGTMDPTGTGGSGGAAPGGPLYRVPVPAELEPWSAYPVAAVQFEREGSAVEIEYAFPIWLSGTLQDVKLTGTYDAGAASFPVSAGALGSGECAVTGTRFSCQEKMPGIVVDRAQAEAAMKQAGVPAADVAQRLRVTDAFSVDPIGVFEFDQP